MEDYISESLLQEWVTNVCFRLGATPTCLTVISHDEARRTCFVAFIVLGRLDDAFWLADRFHPDQRGTTWQAVQRTASAEVTIAFAIALPDSTGANCISKWGEALIHAGKKDERTSP